MQSQNNRRRLLIVGTAAFILLMIIGLVLALRSPAKKSAATSSGSYVDPFSHETVSNPPGKTAENYGVNPNTPLFLGFDKLPDYGLDLSQLSLVESAFDKYSAGLPKPIRQISVDVDHITSQHDSTANNAPFDILFKVQFDQKNIYQAKVEYFSLTDARLYLSDLNTSKTVYDSGVMASSSAQR